MGGRYYADKYSEVKKIIETTLSVCLAWTR